MAKIQVKTKAAGNKVVTKTATESRPVEKRGSLVSTEDDGGSHVLGLIGPPKVGKTWCAMTYSNKWPTEPITKRLAKPLVLDDMLLVQFDPGARDGLTQVNIKVPTIDFSSLTGNNHIEVGGKRITIENCLTVAVREAEAAMQNGTRAVVFDSMTMFQSMLMAKNMSQEGWDLWRAMLKDNIRGLDQLKGLPGVSILTFHTKVLSDDGASKQKRKEMGVEGDATKVPDVPGQSLGKYNGTVSCMFPVEKKKKLGKKGYPFEHVLLPNGTKSYNYASRWIGLDDEEPAHLGKLFKKLGLDFG